MGYTTGKRDFRVSTAGFERPQEPGRSGERSGRVRRGELYGLRDGLEVAGREEVRDRGKVRQRSPCRGEHAGTDNEESDPAVDLCRPGRDSGLSRMVVPGPGK